MFLLGCALNIGEGGHKVPIKERLKTNEKTTDFIALKTVS